MSRVARWFTSKVLRVPPAAAKLLVPPVMAYCCRLVSPTRPWTVIWPWRRPRVMRAVATQLASSRLTEVTVQLTL